jgi:hypothetical protein
MVIMMELTNIIFNAVSSSAGKASSDIPPAPVMMSIRRATALLEPECVGGVTDRRFPLSSY